MKFGVFIRSIGERTEDICYQAVNVWVPKENIHVIKNVSPSYLAFNEMFKQAKEQEYDWFVGLDADVVLSERWMDIIRRELLKMGDGKENMFKITFQVRDRITGEILNRGIHLYNGRFVNEALEGMEVVMQAAKYPMIYRLIGKKKFYVKPESSLAGIVRERYHLDARELSILMGVHGLEQYYHEIFRQFVTRRQRDETYLNTYPEILNTETNDKELNLERKVAKLGWDKSAEMKINKVSIDAIDEYKYFLEENGVIEKAPININFKKFYRNYYDQYFKEVPRKGLSVNDVLFLVSENDIVVDLGANVGSVSEEFLKNGCEVYAYEPHPIAFEKLQNNLSTYKKVHIFNNAVLNKKDKMKLYFHRDHKDNEVEYSTSASLMTDKRDISHSDFAEVDVLDIKDILRAIKGRVKILKIDIEGAEYDVLDHIIENHLYKDIDYIFVETHHHKIDNLTDRHEKIVRDIRDNDIDNIYLGWV